MLRIRAFLLLGSVFLLLAITTMIYYASANLGCPSFGALQAVPDFVKVQRLRADARPHSRTNFKENAGIHVGSSQIVNVVLFL